MKTLSEADLNRLAVEKINTTAPITLSGIGSKPKAFSTGSKGYFLWGKVDIDGLRCQFTGNAVIVGSKDPAVQIPAAITMPDLALTGNGRVFSSGSVGYFIYGKADIAGQRCQISGNLVKIGSKPVAESVQKAA